MIRIRSTICVVILFSIVLSLSGCSFLYSSLELYENTSLVTASSTTQSTTAIVTEEGDCYIRGYVSEDLPYGVSDISAYQMRYNNIFDPFAPDRFVRIYNQHDAKNIILSGEGGCIITKQNALLVFSNNFAEYTYPTYFCNNIIYAKLVADRVYVLNTDHSFGYYEIASPDQFVQLRAGVKKFISSNADSSLWLLTENGVLEMYEDINNLEEKSHSIDDISCFDMICFDYSPRLPHNGYSLAYMTNGGKIFCYRGYGFPIEEKKNEVKEIRATGESVAAYSEGIIVLNQGSALIFGKDIYRDYAFDGVVLADDVIDISADMSTLNVTTTDQFLSFGSLPSSTTYYISEYIEEIQKAGAGSLVP